MEAELSDDNFDDILPEARIFDNRVDDIFNTKMEGYKALYKKNEEEILELEHNNLLEKVALNQKNKKKKPRKTKRGRKKFVPSDEEETPPKIQRRTSPRKKSFKEVSYKDSEENEESPPGVILPASAKRRLKKLQLETAKEKKRIDEETRRILSSCDAVQAPQEEDIQLIDDGLLEQDIVLKIRYMSKISKVTVCQNEVFKSIFEKVADLLGLKATEILLCLGDNNIELSDTPMSLKLKFFDVIDCIPYKVEAKATEDNSNKLLLKIQSNDSRKKTELHVHKLEKFEEIMKTYAELRKMSVKDLVFEFDGEKIEGTETPSDLDMESGSCIDARILNFKEPVSKRLFTVEDGDEVSLSDMQNFCFLD